MEWKEVEGRRLPLRWHIRVPSKSLDVTTDPLNDETSMKTLIPYWEGPVRIEMPDGSVVESDRFMVAICTCRRSKTYPLCDTSHRRKARPSVERTTE